MKTIILKKLRLINFKRARDLSLDFNQITNISGDNATGKTTVFDAFTWLLFGKDSTDRKQFEIKTLDSNNNVIPKLEHEVSAVLKVDGEDIEIKRILKEKWVKKRGALESEFNGNETLYYWNDVPLQQKEFSVKINNLIDEGIFKLITNPQYFNGLKWQDRRDVLIRITGNITDDEIAQGNDEFIKLITGLKDKTIEEYKREISARKKKLNTDLKAIPTRIDEANRSLPELVDFTKIKSETTQLETELKTVEDSILDKSKELTNVQQKRTKLHKEIFDCKTTLQNIEFEEKQKLNSVENENKAKLKSLTQDFTFQNNELLTLIKNVSNSEEKKQDLIFKTDKLRDKWNELNRKKISFSENEFSCPTCKRDFEALYIEDKKVILTSNFQENKSKELSEIQSEGINLSKELEESIKIVASYETDIIDLNKEVDVIKKEIISEEEKLKVPKGGVSFEFILSKIPEYNKLKQKISELESKTIGDPKADTVQLDLDKLELKEKINNNNRLLNDEVIIKRTNSRIDELKQEERNIAQQISNLELSEFTIDSFIKSKIETLENRINDKFKLVKFKLFETQINGSEIECCHTLINGVPYSDLNNAARINAGLDIINTLCKFYKISSSIFIDNAEAVNELIETKSQLIRLVVTKDKKLKIG